MSEYIGLIVSISSVLVGVAAIVISALAYRMSGESHKLAEFNAVATWKERLRAWADEAIDAMTHAIYLPPKQDSDFDSESSDEMLCRSRLSSVIDRGRLLLPNIPDDYWGKSKALASRGFRHQALDYLVAAERMVGDRLRSEVFPGRADALEGLRKEFVSDILKLIDPSTSNRAIADLVKRVHIERANDPTLGGLLPSQTQIPGGSADALRIAEARYLAGRA